MEFFAGGPPGGLLSAPAPCGLLGGQSASAYAHCGARVLAFCGSRRCSWASDGCALLSVGANFFFFFFLLGVEWVTVLVGLG